MKTKELKKYPIQIILMTITFVIVMVIPMLFSYLIDEIIGMQQYSNLPTWFGITLGISIVGVLMNFYFGSYFPVKIGIHNSFVLEKKALKNILIMPQTTYTQKDKGYYYNLCQNSTSSYGDLHEELYLNMISNILYVCGIWGIITYVNVTFGIFFVVYGMVLVLISLKSAKPLYHMQRDILQVQDDYLSSMRNIIENKMNINAIHTEAYFNMSCKETVDKYEKHILRYRFWDYLCANLPSMINQVFNICFLLLATIMVMKQQISVGCLLMTYQYMGYFATPITTICSIAMRYKSNKVHIERVDELEEAAKENKENEPFKKEDEYLLKLNQYDFYKGEEEEDFLYHVDKLELKKNGMYIVKGENGSGKSMLLNLMLGNVSCKDSKGNISIAKEMDKTAFLTYPFFTVNGSFEDNLCGIPRDEELIRLLKIDFEDKEITSNPINLSYGQQQKLALLRVLGLDAPIVFLDEPLSNLDVETQKNLVDYVSGLKGKKTIMIIMHSDEFDDIADGIIRIEKKQMIM